MAEDTKAGAEAQVIPKSSCGRSRRRAHTVENQVMANSSIP